VGACDRGCRVRYAGKRVRNIKKRVHVYSALGASAAPKRYNQVHPNACSAWVTFRKLPFANGASASRSDHRRVGSNRRSLTGPIPAVRLRPLPQSGHQLSREWLNRLPRATQCAAPPYRYRLYRPSKTVSQLDCSAFLICHYWRTDPSHCGVQVIRCLTGVRAFASGRSPSRTMPPPTSPPSSSSAPPRSSTQVWCHRRLSRS
jgi:hypothetical protein